MHLISAANSKIKQRQANKQFPS